MAPKSQPVFDKAATESMDEVNVGVVAAPPTSANHHDGDFTSDVESQVPVTAPENKPSSLKSLSHDWQSPIKGASHVTTTSVKSPGDALKAVYEAGIYKAGLPMNVLIVQSIMAGLYIAVAGQTFLSLGGGILGTIFFPTGLLAVTFASGELFTGDSLIFVASVLGNKVSVLKLFRNWSVAWIFNFAGCLLWAGLLSYASGALEDAGQSDFAVQVALKKANQPWMQIFLKGIGANFLVCLGIWQGTCAEEAAGKIMGLWFPVAAFVIMGFEHCIANQFFIPLGMMFGADISIAHLLFKALLPATLGNIVGGGIFIGAVYWFVFDNMGRSMYLLSRIRRPDVHTLKDVGEGPGQDATLGGTAEEMRA